MALLALLLRCAVVADGHPFTVEYVAPGIVQERSADGLLVIFNVDNGYPVTIESWAGQVASILSGWPAQHPCSLLHDVHKLEPAALEAHVWPRWAEMLAGRPELEQRTAFILPGILDTTVVQTALLERGHAPPDGGRVLWQLFLARQEALDWLLRG
jgi:hypothetical protein